MGICRFLTSSLSSVVPAKPVKSIMITGTITAVCLSKHLMTKMSHPEFELGTCLNKIKDRFFVTRFFTFLYFFAMSMAKRRGQVWWLGVCFNVIH